MKVVVIGSTGQLGTDLMEVLSREPDIEPIGMTHKEMDVSSPSDCVVLTTLRPDAVVNTAAFHKTDSCEDEPMNAFRVNAVGSYNLAKASDAIGATYVYISTDFVFSGDKSQPYEEGDAPRPINVYGATKLAGELFASAYARKHYVVRSSSLFGKAGASGKGGNFVETIIRKAKTDGRVAVVDDIVMSPTYTMDLAGALARMIGSRPPFGVYHAANLGFCSWWEFASEIVSRVGLNARVERVKSKEYPTKAARPRFSALSIAKLSKHGIHMRRWQEALSDYLGTKGLAADAAR